MTARRGERKKGVSAEKTKGGKKVEKKRKGG